MRKPLALGRLSDKRGEQDTVAITQHLLKPTPSSLIIIAAMSTAPVHRKIDENWIRSDRYHNSFLIKPDDGLEHALKTSNDSGLPQIAVSAAEGKLLHLITKTMKAKKILEVGTLGGYASRVAACSAKFNRAP